MATALFAAACGVSAPEDSGPTVDQRVYVLPDVSGMVIDAGTVTVPRENNGTLAGLPKGTILVSTVGEGFLREIDSVTATSQTITIATHDADLSNALVDGQIATSLGGDGKADTYQLPGISLSFANRQLVNNAAITATLTSGKLTFAPELELDMSISGHSVDNFAMLLRGRITGTLDLDIAAHAASIGPEIRLWDSAPAIFYQQVGVLPVVETVTTSVVLRLEATTAGSGHIRIDTSALAQFEGGITYNDDAGWDGVAEASLTAQGSLPEKGLSFERFGVRAWLAARTDVRLYGIAGPFAMVGPQAELSRAVSGGAIDASVGLRAGVGGGLKFMKVNVPACPTFDILDVTRPIL